MMLDNIKDEYPAHIETLYLIGLLLPLLDEGFNGIMDSDQVTAYDRLVSRVKDYS